MPPQASCKRTESHVLVRTIFKRSERSRKGLPFFKRERTQVYISVDNEGLYTDACWKREKELVELVLRTPSFGAQNEQKDDVELNQPADQQDQEPPWPAWLP
ncbi:hypothetical protein QAD02_019840 [Eretmocerus hayati]|uniref:Uncharacterized protein n=2 Tax=Eretmocerus hayati TaxID=131215 RepID=A0ACC2PL82_9HYME|nr:hypothetical protein QAD02_019836 [Eretmocerus hayati]KAJ8684048.1 hypothetical protein QAD02_019840 [Eretmocerus hayati]